MLQVGDQRTAASSFQVTARGSHRLAEIDPNVLVAIASRTSTVMRRMASIIAQSIFGPIPLSGVTLFDSFEKTTVQDARVHESSTPRLKKKLVRKPSAAWCWRRRFLLLAKEGSRHHQPPLRARLLKCRARFHGLGLGGHQLSRLLVRRLDIAEKHAPVLDKRNGPAPGLLGLDTRTRRHAPLIRLSSRGVESPMGRSHPTSLWWRRRRKSAD
jgi:hypothetical protein